MSTPLHIDVDRMMSGDREYQHELNCEIERRRHLPISDPQSDKRITLQAKVRSAWVTSTVQRTRVPSHLVSGAATRWSADGCRLIVEAVCGSVISKPHLTDDPEDDNVCDGCVLKHEDWIVYRYFDADGAVIYIGCTNDQLGRMYQHSRSTPWWHEVRSQQVERYPSRDEGLAAEALAIRTEYPLYNVRGKAAA